MNARPDGAANDAPAAKQTPGEMLRRQREQRGWSIQQAAEELHLDPKMVEAIEANRFIVLGAPVYAKGHLRKYALLLGLSVETVMMRYQALHDTPGIPTLIPASSVPLERRRSKSLAPLWIGLLLLLGAIMWWLAG